MNFWHTGKKIELSYLSKHPHQPPFGGLAILKVFLFLVGSFTGCATQKTQLQSLSGINKTAESSFSQGTPNVSAESTTPGPYQVVPPQAPPGEENSAYAKLGPIEQSVPNPTPPPTPMPAYGPEPHKVKPVVLIFGPGFAKGLTYIGVIRALEESKIPIGAIFGTEMGSLVGAMYALSGNVNDFEWVLQKFKFETLGGENAKDRFISKFFDVKKQNEMKFEKQLEQIFSHKDLTQLKIPLRISVRVGTGQVSSIVKRGEVVSVVRAAFSRFWNSKIAPPVADLQSFPVDEAKALGIGPVIVLDAMSPPGARSDDLALADMVISLDVSDIQDEDFHMKTEAAYRGKKTLLLKISEIRKSIGLEDLRKDPS